MRTLLILMVTFLVGCATAQKPTPSPSVSTGQLIGSLTDIQTELQQAGESHPHVAANIDRALSLAERLDALLDQIEKEQQTTADKNVLKAIK